MKNSLLELISTTQMTWFFKYYKYVVYCYCIAVFIMGYGSSTLQITMTFANFFIQHFFRIQGISINQIASFFYRSPEQAYIPIEKIIRTSKQSASTSWQCNTSGNHHQPATYGDLCLKWTAVWQLFVFIKWSLMLGKGWTTPHFCHLYQKPVTYYHCAP